MRFREGESSWRPTLAPLPRWVLFVAAGIAGFVAGFAVALKLARGREWLRSAGKRNGSGSNGKGVRRW